MNQRKQGILNEFYPINKRMDIYYPIKKHFTPFKKLDEHLILSQV